MEQSSLLSSKKRKIDLNEDQGSQNESSDYKVVYVGATAEEPSTSKLEFIVPLSGIEPIVLGRNNVELENVLDSFVSRNAASIAMENRNDRPQLVLLSVHFMINMLHLTDL